MQRDLAARSRPGMSLSMQVQIASARPRDGVLLEDPADLAMDLGLIESVFWSGRYVSARRDSAALMRWVQLLMHRVFFAATLGRAAQDDRVPGLRTARELHLDALAQRAPTGGAGQCAGRTS